MLFPVKCKIAIDGNQGAHIWHFYHADTQVKNGHFQMLTKVKSSASAGIAGADIRDTAGRCRPD